MRSAAGKLGPLAALLAFIAAPGPLLADGAEIHTYHCLHGCPMGAAATNDLIVREIYTLSSNDRTKFADWVAYQVRPDAVGGDSPGRGWRKDPWLAADETLEPDDYTGAPAALDIERGHQAPLAAFTGTAFARDTNVLSNITPQQDDLNSRSWKILEERERQYAVRKNAPLYVLTGTLYERQMRGMPQADEPHRVPSGYWKVLAVQTGAVTQVSAFIFEQETPAAANYCDMRKPLADIERRSGLRLFPRLVRRNFTSLDRDVGCP